MARIIKTKLKATILEPLIALMIILFSLTASVTLILKLNSQNNALQFIRAASAIDDILLTTLTEKDFISSEIQLEGIRIEKEIDWYDRANSLLKLEISAYDNKGKILLQRRKILIIHE